MKKINKLLLLVFTCALMCITGGLLQDLTTLKTTSDVFLWSGIVIGGLTVLCTFVLTLSEDDF